jgi:hypothetical protein
MIIVTAVAARQHVDWRDHRLRDQSDPEVRGAIARLTETIIGALDDFPLGSDPDTTA